jgi:hypothetical protein
MPLGLLMAATLGAGCRTLQVSVEPFFQATEAPAEVAGRWLAEGDDDVDLEFIDTGENQWRLFFFEAKEDGRREDSGARVRFGRVDGTLYWDMTTDTSGLADLAREHLLELHSVARVRLEGDTMEVAFLRPEWMSDQLDDGRLDLAHFHDPSGGKEATDILTAPTEELEAFLREHGEDRDAFDEPLVFHRVS